MNSETNRVEYKRELIDDLEKEVIAFLNYHEGGVIYIGIDKTGKAVGVSDIDGDMLKIKDRLKNNIMPSCMGLFDVSVEGVDSKNVIKITLASGTEKPYYIKKLGMSERGTFIRVGTSAEPMPVKMIESLFAKRTRNSIGKIKSPNQNLTFEQLKIYYEGSGKTLNQQFTSNLELITEEGEYNYVAYLLADTNGISVKVAKYNGFDRVDLTENNEYGYCSLIKATKQVLDKIEVENKTLAKITPKERKETKLWNPVALREAVINAIVHNDYTSEVPPKFEFFDDRIEITSFGSLPQGMTEKEFFEGYSVPRNKELMRVFRDLDLVEHLGSGVPRILKSYGKECFKFTENFLRMIFPASEQVTEQVTEQVKELVRIMSKEMDRQEIQEKLGLSHRENFRSNYLKPALEQGFIEMTIPNKPNSSLQKYRLTVLGKQLKVKLFP
ncbi:transcriptional regulator [Porphyromonas gingivalis SJD12]|uniref:Fic family protein n=1 Tax=Porphyromonas gingivalis TaxID=837 RepID=UPI0003AD1E90|nr:RNA-binding domain-containing protein [Porphyromonas gingivalis]ERJ85570.1 divergent AAA domain protein [Porphyromonas gingivalis F0185]OWR81801.1 transcriptional regulator [Porphyromonas gingivalis SJD12]